MHKAFAIDIEDGTKLFTNRWEPDSKPKAVIQIAHGMAEHSARYQNFALALTSKCYSVYGHDHRGHGKTAKEQKDLGFFSEEKGWEKVVLDLYAVTQKIKADHPDLPVFLFGHSMGSYVARTYIQEYGDQIQGVILSGTGAGLGILAPVALRIAKSEIKRVGKRGESERLNRLTFGNYNKPFEPVRTPFDWLSREEQEVDKYIEDPLCGGVSSSSFYYDMFRGLQLVTNKTRCKQIPKSLPIYLISGDKDPVGGFGKGVQKTYHFYENLGIKDLQIKLYPEARHEILNETNKEEVINNIIEWIENHIKS